MRVDAFDFELPEELIALRPVEPREAARLLVVGGEGGDAGDRGALADKHFSDLPDLLRPGDVLVFNDTRVIHARLTGIRRRAVPGQEPAEARIEVTLTEPEADRAGAPVWRGFARPGKRLRDGERIVFSDDFSATVLAKGEAGAVTLSFETGGRNFAEALEAHGTMPLPPYIAARRAPDAKDDDDYQTVFAAHDGSVAAPTAGLHFSAALLDALDGAGISRAMVTLHVGPGTFLPVKAADTSGHHMHAEWGSLSTACARQLNRARAAGGRIVAVGTTALRLLESAADDAGLIHPFEGETDIFITPGYRFKATDLMITNFHLPRSTLFMLVSAFSGLETMKQAYAHAIAARYRFYSYGDGCLLHPAEARA